MQSGKTLTEKEISDVETTLIAVVSRLSAIRAMADDITQGVERRQSENLAAAIVDMATMAGMSLDTLNQRLNGNTCAHTGDANAWLEMAESWRRQPAQEEL